LNVHDSCQSESPGENLDALLVIGQFKIALHSTTHLRKTVDRTTQGIFAGNLDTTGFCFGGKAAVKYTIVRTLDSETREAQHSIQ
jgi:hypothetical protein